MKTLKFFSHIFVSIARWFDTGIGYREEALFQREGEVSGVDWVRCIPFLFMHGACLAVFWAGWSNVAVWTAVALYAVRMFAITGFYHRYFSHRTFRTSRVAQFLFAVLGASSVQRGPLWWAGHHRHHHLHSDQPEDLHSPRLYGFWWSHMGWITSRKNFATRFDRVPDLAKYPELVFLNRFDIVIPVLLAVSLFLSGWGLGHFYPQLGTSGFQMLVWGFFISTVVLFHATCTINSLSHVVGRQRFQTNDDSRNNFFLALLAFGEGWHNNHHHYHAATRQGIYWWELDLTYYVLKTLSWLGIVWDLSPVPDHVYEKVNRQKKLAK